MCIIAIKPTGRKIDWSRMQNMWNANPDGAGFAYHAPDGLVHISKGYMTFKSFKRAVKKSGIRREHEAMFHFRIGTHGGVTPECTHPFPLTDDTTEMQSLDSDGPVAIAHNGIIFGVATSPGVSDTMAFIGECLAPLGLEFLVSEAARPLLELATDSKLAIMTAKGVITIGDFTTSKGWQYSNTTFTTPKVTPKVKGKVTTKVTTKGTGTGTGTGAYDGMGWGSEYYGLETWNQGARLNHEWDGLAVADTSTPSSTDPITYGDMDWGYCELCGVEVGAAWERIPDNIMCVDCATRLYVSQ